MTPRSVVIAHRAAMVAEGIAAALARYPSIVPIAVATNAADGERAGERADAIALDLYLDGVEATALRLQRKGVRVVFLGEDGSLSDEGEQVRVSTRSSVASLASALVPGAPERRPTRQLTKREREILSLVAQGMPGKQVARNLGISPKTVEQHKTRIYAKLGVRNQTAAVRAAFEGRLEGTYSWNPSTI
jgi:DNA-binding NarL/FixJ family response regulator